MFIPSRLSSPAGLSGSQRWPVHEPGTSYRLSCAIRTLTTQCRRPAQPIAVLCIGTDRSTGDALGPLTGSKLQLLQYDAIYGTLDDPVHAANLQDKLQSIYATINDPFILAVDASLGKADSVGYIAAASGSLKPGAAVNKNLPPVGDAHITGIVNVGGFMEQLVLQSTRLQLVMKMAETIAYGIYWALRK